jgi:hypothetical protein
MPFFYEDPLSRQRLKEQLEYERALGVDRRARRFERNLGLAIVLAVVLSIGSLIYAGILWLR